MISLSAAQVLTAMILTPSAGMLKFCRQGDVGLFGFRNSEKTLRPKDAKFFSELLEY